MANDNLRLWTNGYILLGSSTRVPIQGITVDLGRDLKEYYDAGASKPATLLPGQETYDFTIKRVFSNTTMVKIFLNRCSFTMILFNNSSNPGTNTQGEAVCSLMGCMLSKDSFGLGDNGEPVQEDISGKATEISFNLTEIAKMVNPACTNI